MFLCFCSQQKYWKNKYIELYNKFHFVLFYHRCAAILAPVGSLEYPVVYSLDAQNIPIHHADDLQTIWTTNLHKILIHENFIRKSF